MSFTIIIICYDTTTNTEGRDRRNSPRPIKVPADRHKKKRGVFYYCSTWRASITSPSATVGGRNETRI